MLKYNRENEFSANHATKMHTSPDNLGKPLKQPIRQQEQRPKQQQISHQQVKQASSSSPSPPLPPPPSTDLTEFERHCFNALDAFLTKTRHQTNLLVSSKSLDVQLESGDVTNSWQRPVNLDLNESEENVTEHRTIIKRSLSEQKPRLPPLPPPPSYMSTKKPSVEVGRSPHKLIDHHSTNLVHDIPSGKHHHHYANHMRHFQPAYDPNPSPTRKSPTSPSWSRFPRESPTRSPNSRSKSPTNNANRFFESDYFSDDVERKDILSSLSSSSEESLNDRKSSDFKGIERDENGLVTSTNGDDDIYTYDLASFAASVHSSTKHLMSLNASPPDCNYEKFSQVLESSEKLLSECYFDHKALPKHLQNLNSTAPNRTGSQPLIQQKQQLPDHREEIGNYAESQVNKSTKLHFSQTDDWSPIRDLLYPILDVSPSVEQMEESVESGKYSGTDKKERMEKIYKSIEKDIETAREIENDQQVVLKHKQLPPKPSKTSPTKSDRADNWSNDMPRRFPGQLTPVDNDSDDEHGKNADLLKQTVSIRSSNTVTSWFDKSSLFGNNDNIDQLDGDFLSVDFDNQIVFVNSDEDREIDLDEDIPPKPIMNRRTTKSKQQEEQNNSKLDNIGTDDQIKIGRIIDDQSEKRDLCKSDDGSISSIMEVKDLDSATQENRRSPPKDVSPAMKTKITKQPPPPPPKQRTFSHDEVPKYLKSKVPEPMQVDDKSNDNVNVENIGASSVKSIIQTFENVQDNKINILKEDSPVKRSFSRSPQAPDNRSEQISHQMQKNQDQPFSQNISKAHDSLQRQCTGDDERGKSSPSKVQMQSQKSLEEKPLQRNKQSHPASDSYSPKRHIENRGSFHQRDQNSKEICPPRATLVMNNDNIADTYKKQQQSVLRDRPCTSKNQESPKHQTTFQRQQQQQQQKHQQHHRQQQHYQPQQNNHQQQPKPQTDNVQNQQQSKNPPNKKFKRPMNPKSTQIQQTSKSSQRAPPVPPYKSPHRRPPHNGSDPTLSEPPYLQSPLEQGLRKRSTRPQQNQRHLPPQPQTPTSDHEHSANRSGSTMHKRGAVSMHDLDDYSSSASPYHGHYPELSDYNLQQHFHQQPPNSSPARHSPHHAKKMPNSQSLTSLPVTSYETDYASNIYDIPCNYAISNELQNEKQEKLLKLQEEIEKRKYHLSELNKTQLQQQYQQQQQQQQHIDQLPSRWFTKPEVEDYDLRLYNNPDQSLGYPTSSPLSKHRMVDQQRQHKFIHNPENARSVYMGLIKPIDYQINPEDFISDENILASQIPPVCPAIDPIHSHVYSSVEYLAHKSGESGQYQYLPNESKLVEQYLDRKATEINQQMRPIGRKPKTYMDAISKRRSESEYAGVLNEAAYVSTFKGSLGYLNALLPGTDPHLIQQRRDQMISDMPVPNDYLDSRPGLCLDDLELSRQTFADILTLNKPFISPEIYPELTMHQDKMVIDDQIPIRRGERYVDDNIMEMRNYGGHLTRDVMTPAMTILDDVPSRTRNILRDIGSRPLSDDLEKYFQQTDDSVGLVYREESLNSVAESNDEFVMEGGITIKMQMEKKKKSGTMERLTQKYSFETKRILFTPDIRDKNLGLKIVSGKTLGLNAEDETGAFVLSIYPGSVAEQLHGELHEGDQVLEWNGEPLSGKKDQEILQIMTKAAGEVELVIKSNAYSSTHPSNTMSTFTSRSVESSFDNMQNISDYGTPNMTPASIRKDAGINESNSQASFVNQSGKYRLSSNVPSPSPAMSVTPNLSNRRMESVSSLKSQSDSNERMKTQNYGQSVAEEIEPFIGEIQIQLNYDDFDNSLNVHVIRAKNIQPIRKSNLVDAFVKICLLPIANPKDCRKTKPIEKTLNPEWNRSFVFLGVDRLQLMERAVEVSVWDHDKFLPNAFIGEVVIDFIDKNRLDNRPHWYQLCIEDRHTPFGGRPRSSLSSESLSSTPNRSIGSGSVHSNVRGVPTHGLNKSPQKEPYNTSLHASSINKDPSTSSIGESSYGLPSQAQTQPPPLPAPTTAPASMVSVFPDLHNVPQSTSDSSGYYLSEESAGIPGAKSDGPQSRSGGLIVPGDQWFHTQIDSESFEIIKNQPKKLSEASDDDYKSTLSDEDKIKQNTNVTTDNKTADDQLSHTDTNAVDQKQLERSTQELDQIFQELSEASRNIQKSIDRRSSSAGNVLEESKIKAKSSPSQHQASPSVNDLKISTSSPEHLPPLSTINNTKQSPTTSPTINAEPTTVEENKSTNSSSSCSIETAFRRASTIVDADEQLETLEVLQQQHEKMQQKTQQRQKSQLPQQQLENAEESTKLLKVDSTECIGSYANSSRCSTPIDALFEDAKKKEMKLKQLNSEGGRGDDILNNFFDII